jgi:Xaa-Pro aminopeptidase
MGPSEKSEPSEMFAHRRRHFLDAIAERGNDAVCVLAATPVFTRNGDVEHDWRQDSDFYYVTGFVEPASVVVFDVGASRKTTMFVRPSDPEREIWYGRRWGVDGVKAHFDADEAFPIDDLASELPKLFENKKRLYYRLGVSRAMDDVVLQAIDKTRARARRGIGWPVEIIEPGTILHEMRLIKSAGDLEAMKHAASITAEAHIRAMARAKAGMYEYEVEALLLETFRARGSERTAYGSIVGSGENATILHYRSNNKKMNDGELVLIDAGCEYDYFASDVTRTFPISGTFSKEQQAIYELVLEAQQAAIPKARKGSTLEQVHNACVNVITRGLVKLGLLEGEVEELIENEAYKPFYMHKSSHWLGMDVHDVGTYYEGGKPRLLEPGMVLTVEPGIYIGQGNDKVAPNWRGIGVRIEDNLVVTSGEPTNLTQAIPKTIADLRQAFLA